MSKKHITVCVCTYKRPVLLKKLIQHVVAQETNDLFTISLSIVDNDSELSAKSVVDEINRDKRIEIEYSSIPERNLAVLRNASLERSRGDYVAFIDDDEYPKPNWLLLLFMSLLEYKASAALGPVVPEYQVEPPRWLIKGRLCERERRRTGSDIPWWKTRTGNALVERGLLTDINNKFDPKFRLGGEDINFFKRLAEKGHKFVWCDEALVHESIPPKRLKASYFYKRSRLIGFMEYTYYKDARGWKKNLLFLLKSYSALVVYLLLAPLNLLRGYHQFVKLIIRWQFHKAVILTSLGYLKETERCT